MTYNINIYIYNSFKPMGKNNLSILIIINIIHDPYTVGCH